MCAPWEARKGQELACQVHGAHLTNIVQWKGQWLQGEEVQSARDMHKQPKQPWKVRMKKWHLESHIYRHDQIHVNKFKYD